MQELARRAVACKGWRWIHKRRLLRRTGWHVCECDGCKVRARTEAEFRALADALHCPATVAECREVSNG